MGHPWGESEADRRDENGTGPISCAPGFSGVNWTCPVFPSGWGSVSDYAELVACMTVPGTAAADDCICPDADTDEDVDLADFAALQRWFLGP